MPRSRANADDGDFRTLPQQVAAELRRRIVLGEFPPGAHLPERETSAALGVSRTPLREALRILASEGLVVIRPARSPEVADPSAQDLVDLFSVLRVLEALAGELACLRAGPAEIDEIRACHARLLTLVARGEPAAFFDADMAFHEAIVRAADNAALLKSHADYNSRLRRARFMTSRVDTDRARIAYEHAQILAAIEARDTRWAAATLDTHLRSANRKILEAYGEDAAEKRRPRTGRAAR
ncbi:FCD domain-containing protein [Rhodobacteraceae bacterium 2CG4]|uniref:FCD domain-containing protein n=1 Tax=Halovulum marinum TaxID=2662447 RepID=A0A6L5YX29_9RHOB|nr:GntR family transcriptional regulator [Halovulum marinum]MSU88767.1 FCD domain-containing protein [Halovulum marinum]